MTTDTESRGQSDALVLSADDGGVRLLTLNRPAKRNALSYSLVIELLAALSAADAADNVRVIVVTGAGESFCAGADLRERLGSSQSAEIVARAEAMARLQSAFVEMRKPVLCAVRGHALGAGCGLALAADWTVCGTSATFGYPEVTVGVLPALITPGLVRRAGALLTFDLLTSGRRLSANEALAVRLIGSVVADEAVLEGALAAARRLSERDPRLIAEVKRLIAVASDLSFADAMRASLAANVASRLEHAADK